jgi:hypothetical protein
MSLYYAKVNHTHRLSVYLSLHPALESRDYLPAAEQLDACAADIAYLQVPLACDLVLDLGVELNE